MNKGYSGVCNGTAADSNGQQRCGHRSEAAPELCGIIFHIPIPPFVLSEDTIAEEIPFLSNVANQGRFQAKDADQGGIYML